MNHDRARTLRTVLRRLLLVTGMLAGIALTCCAGWVGLEVAPSLLTFRYSCGSGHLLSTARLRVKAANYATAQYMIDNSSQCPRGIDELVAQKYLDRNNAKDPWGKDLIFNCPGTCDTSCADISSIGPDQKEGTADDIKSWELN